MGQVAAPAAVTGKAVSASLYPLALVASIGALGFIAFRWRGRGARTVGASAAAAKTPLTAAHGKMPKPAPRAKIDFAVGKEASAETRAELHKLAFDVSALAPRVPAAHAKIINEVLAALEDAITQAKYLPRRPRMIPELMSALSDAESSWRKVATLIARDPSLTADLLKLANSPLYRITEDPIESIDRAVAVLGTNGVRSLIATAIMQPVFKVGSAHFKRFPQTIWDHASLSGLAAETCAALIDDEDPFAAQLLALLLGLGAIVVFRVVEDRYKAEPTLQPCAEAIAMLITLQGAAIARRIAASWEVSQRMTAALDDQSAAARGAYDNLTPLGRAVLLGDRLGAIAALLRAGRLDMDGAKAAAVAQGAPAVFAEQLLKRLVR
jgi:HD-like signal output (HDOD) protein